MARLPTDQRRSARGSSGLRGAAVAGLLNATGSILAVAVFGRAFIAAVGLERYGAWGVISLLASVPTLLDFGFSRESVFRIVSARDAAERVAHVSNLLAYACVASVASILIASLFLLAGPGRLGALDHGTPYHVWLAACLSIVITGVLSFLRTAAEALNRLAFVAYGFLAQTILTYLFAASSAARFRGGALIFYSHPAALLIVLLGSLTLFPTIVRDLGRPGAPSARMMWKTLRDGTGYGWAGALSYLILPLNRGFILHHDGSLALAGVFDILTRICEAASTVLTSAFTPLYRHFLQPLARTEKRILVLRSEAAATIAFVGGVTAYALIARPLLTYLLATDASAFVRLAIVVLALRTAHGIAEPTTRLLWANDNKAVVLQARVVAFTMNVVLLLVLNSVAPLAWTAGLAYAIPFVISAFLIMARGRARLSEFRPMTHDSGTLGAQP